MKLLRKTFLTILATCFASASHAGLIYVDALGPVGDSTSIAANNNFRATLLGLGIDEYSTGYSLGTDVAGTVSFFYYGKEAGYRNDFLAAGLAHSTGYTSFQNRFGSPLEIGTLSVGPGVLDFRFCAYSGGNTAVGCVSNAQNDGLSFNSFQSIAMYVEANTAWLFWDDSGAGPDDNHDDMIIRAVFQPVSVSEPGMLALLGLTLFGAGLIGRRRSK